MNPLFLLLGLFGLGAAGASSRSSTTVSEGSAPPVVDVPSNDDDDGDSGMDMGGDDHAGHDDGDSGTDMGGDDDHAGHDDGDSGTDTGGDDDHAGHDDGDSGTDMGGDDDHAGHDDGDSGTDMGGDDDHAGHDDGDSGTDMGGDDDHAGHDDGDSGTDTGGDDDHAGHDDGDSGTDMGGDDDHAGHDMGVPDIPPPGVGASATEINDYLSALAAASEVHVHDPASSMSEEHNAVLDLVPRGGASHVAIGNGDWNDPSIWSGGEVPGDGATVLIPDGVQVDYGIESDARLFTVRVDGMLDFATDTNSQIIFDTFVVSPTGHLVMGTQNDPVQSNVDIDMIVADNGPIDTNWDPMLLSRGLVSHGDVTVHGAVTDSHEKVADDPMAGDTSVTFDTLPEGWQVGDTIVVAGTSYSWGESQDETRVISAIEDGRVYFDSPLEFNHDSPRDDLSTSVANYTRNVSIESENGADTEIFARGHVMFMHSDEVDVRYMEFSQLGRTDKSEDSFDVSDLNNTNFDSNVQGRYSLHLHRTGVSDQDNPTILEGNAVYGSPGWGVVHHDSHAVLTNNATFDTFGSGFVAETGNETGAWNDNIAIFAEGIHWGEPKNTSTADEDTFDTARGGEGFWFQGRLIEASDNVAASVNVGYAFFHRDGDGRMIDFDASLFDYSDALYGASNVTADQAPILDFNDNEAFAANEGLHVVKSSTQQGHDVWTHMDGFTAWNVLTGANLEYTAHYLLSDFDLVGGNETAFVQPQVGIYLGNNMNEIVISGAQIDGFSTGIDLNKEFVGPADPNLHQYIIIDPTFTNNGQDFANYDPSLDRILTSDQLQNVTPDIDLQPMTYSWGNSTIEISGTKTDSLGTVDFPGGLDNFDIPSWESTAVLDHYGYWTTSDGQNYMLLDIYFTDRATGEVFYQTHPVMIADDVRFGTTVNNSEWLNTPFNGQQDIVTQGGVTMAGDQALYQTIAATPNESSLTLSSMPDMMDHQSMVAMTTNQVENDDQDAPAQVESQTLAVFEAAARVEFDGDPNDTEHTDTNEMSLLMFDEDTVLAFGTENGELPPLVTAEAEDGSQTVDTGIDLGDATLAIDLSGLSEQATSSLTLMSADEIIGVFGEAIVDSLDARDARILINYETDQVSLEISEGSGVISIDTLGEQTDVSSDQQALWDALTQGQPILADQAMNDDDEDLPIFEAA